MSNLSKNIRYLRTQRGLKQEDLADFFHYKSYTTVSKWESGESEPSAGVTKRIAEFFKVSMDDLVNTDLTVEKSILEYTKYPFINDYPTESFVCEQSNYDTFPKLVFPDVLLGKYARRKDIIIMRVNDESMNNIVAKGSYVAALLGTTLEELTNEDLVVLNNGFQYSIRRFYRLVDKIVFKPDSKNATFTDQIYSNDDDLNIFGKVVMYNILLD